MTTIVTTWNPQWLTTDEFSNISPISLNHREQEPDVLPIGPRNRHILIRGAFRLPSVSDNQQFILRITADDYYKVYIDGMFLGQGPAPSIPEHYYYNEMLLPQFVNSSAEKPHVVAIHLYYQGLINRVWNSGDGRCAMAAELIPAIQDGEIEGSTRDVDVNWKYTICDAFSGDTIAYDTQFLENFDCRKWDDMWCMTDYNDALWKPMLPATWADYVLSPQETKPLSLYVENPKLIGKSAIDNMNYVVLDFCHEITASIIVDVKAEHAGEEFIIRCGEELDNDGRVRYDMRCLCRYEETIICRDGENHVEQYDYKGFRYVEIVYPNTIEINQVRGLVRHYPMNYDHCVFHTSNNTLQQIFEICRRGVMLGTQEGYLDCPTREKGQYLGDAIITSRSHLWLTGSSEMLKKCIDQFANTAMIDPGLMGVAPGGVMQEIADFSLLFSQLLLTWFDFTGDAGLLAKYEPICAGIIKHFNQFAGDNGLLYTVGDKWNLVDWPENLRDNYDFPLTRPVVANGCHNVINALYIGAIKTYGMICDIIGKESVYDSAPLESSFFECFYNDSTGLFVDAIGSKHSSLHSNIYPLFFGFVPKKKEPAICDFLVEKGLCCGVMVSYYMLKALANAGRRGDMYRLLLNGSEHGWVQMLREGATSCFEAWGKNQKWNTSLCHPWASGPISLIIEEIVGIRVNRQENSVICQPYIPDDRDSFNIEVTIRNQRYSIKIAGGSIISTVCKDTI